MGFVLPVIELCVCVVLGCRYSPETTGPCSQWCHFLNWGVFECDIAHRRSVAVLCMPYKFRCNPMHPLCGALPGPHVPVRLHVVRWSHIGTYMRLLTAEPRNTEDFYFFYQHLGGMILVTPVTRLAGFKSRTNAFLLT